MLKAEQLATVDCKFFVDPVNIFTYYFTTEDQSAPGQKPENQLN